jgi:hypothetical protein
MLKQSNPACRGASLCVFNKYAAARCHFNGISSNIDVKTPPKRGFNWLFWHRRLYELLQKEGAFCAFIV